MIDASLLLESINDSMVVVTPSGEVVFFNNIAKSYEEISSVPLNIGISIYDAFPGEYRDLTKILLEGVVSSRIQQTAEVAFRHPSGYIIYFDLVYKPLLHLDNNEVSYVLLVGRDITAQKTFEKKSTQLIRELSNLIENANAVIFGIDGQHYITEWNNECAQLTGKEKDHVLAKPLSEVFPEAGGGEFSRILNGVFKGNPVKHYEFRIHRERTTVTLLINITPKLSMAGQIIGAIFLGQDITELLDYKASLETKVEERTLKLKEALQQEKEMVELRNKLMSIASHEFKIPLSAINNSVHELRKSSGVNENEKHFLDTIEAHVSRMKQLLEDILQARKNDTSRIKANLKLIDMVSFLQQLAADVTLAAAHSHVIVIKHSEPAVFLHTDEKLLRNIFVNLLSNAVKFSPGSNEVVVSIESFDDLVVVTVADKGIGISESEAHKVFEPFTRGTNVGQIKGTGLGLSIVKKAVETLEGTMAFQSAEGEGTTFTVKFRRSLTNSNIENEVHQNIAR